MEEGLSTNGSGFFWWFDKYLAIMIKGRLQRIGIARVRQ
jgi:hypothetical protein